jgi:hypothetical protein
MASSPPLSFIDDQFTIGPSFGLICDDRMQQPSTSRRLHCFAAVAVLLLVSLFYRPERFETKKSEVKAVAAANRVCNRCVGGPRRLSLRHTLSNQRVYYTLQFYHEWVVGKKGLRRGWSGGRPDAMRVIRQVSR